MKYTVALLALVLSACGGSKSTTSPTPVTVPSPHVVGFGPINWGYRPQDGFSSFSGQVRNDGVGCTGPLVSGVATLWNGTAGVAANKVSSGLFQVSVNSTTNVMRPGEVRDYEGMFIPAVPPGTPQTGYTLAFELSDAAMARTCPPSIPGLP